MRQRALVFLCVVVLAGCSGGEPVAMSQNQITTIDIHDFYYSPAAVMAVTRSCLCPFAPASGERASASRRL